jgi:hypothetical protein
VGTFAVPQLRPYWLPLVGDGFAGGFQH